MVFVWMDCEAGGGSTDVAGRRDTLADAVALARAEGEGLTAHRWEILDLTDGEWIRASPKAAGLAGMVPYDHRGDGGADAI